MSKAQPGLIIEGKYRLLSPLGAGAMGSVWLAEQMSVDRKVAIKLLHPANTDSSGMNARFAVEAKAIARLNHPNCITLFDFGFSKELDSYYTVIEYVKGSPLGKRLLKTIDVQTSIDIVCQVAKGLDHAHFHNILHRDLKPDNIMITQQNDGQEVVKILDFGIAKIVSGKFGDEDDEDVRLTRAGDVFGTPAYMSPEQARSTRSLTPASDLYALGVIFFEMIEGELPFTAASSFDILMMHVTDEVPRLQRKGLPPEVSDVIYKLLEKHPDDRFQNGKDIIDALSRIDIPEALAQPQLGSSASGALVVPRPAIETERFFASSDSTLPPRSQQTITAERPANRKSFLIPALAILLIPALGILIVASFFWFNKGGAQGDNHQKLGSIVIKKDLKKPEKKTVVESIEEKTVFIDHADDMGAKKMLDGGEVTVEAEVVNPTLPKAEKKKSRKISKSVKQKKNRPTQEPAKKIQFIKPSSSKVKKLGL